MIKPKNHHYSIKFNRMVVIFFVNNSDNHTIPASTKRIDASMDDKNASKKCTLASTDAKNASKECTTCQHGRKECQYGRQEF